MRQIIYFSFLGLFAYILFMIIIIKYISPETVLYFVLPFAIPFVIVFSSILGAQFSLIPGKAQMVKINIKNEENERRNTARYKVDHYAGEITLPDGVKINILLNDVSPGGFQISCSEVAGQDLSQKFSRLRKIKSIVELKANIPIDKRIEQIQVCCKIAYVRKKRDKKETFSYVAGLAVTEFKNNSNATIDKLIDKLSFAVA